MRSFYVRTFSFILLALFWVAAGSLMAQSGRAAKRAALKTRNKQISRFTVRTDFSKSKKYISYGGGVGMSNYFGDLAPNNTRTSTDMSYTRLYLTGYYLQRVHPNVTIRGAVSWMRLRGDDFSVSEAGTVDASDLGRFIRNLSFRNNVVEFSGVGVFELFPTDRGYLRRNFFNPYGIFGLSVFTHNPTSKTPQPTKPGDPKSEWVSLRSLGTEGQFTGIAGTPRPYSVVQVGVPIGFGLRYRLQDKFDLSLEFGYRFVFTDYLDDVSGRYPSDEVLQEMYNQGNYLGITMSNRSAETFAAIEGQNRTTALANIARTYKVSERAYVNNRLKDWEYYVRDVSKQPTDPNVDIRQNPAFFLPDGSRSTDQSSSFYRRIKGNDYGAAPRGNKRRDYWLVTALNLSYILEIKQKPPKFR
jgi:hypothetical protein